MWDTLREQPGLLYVAATLLPLASFFIILLLGGIRNAVRPYGKSGLGQKVFWLAGGDIPGKVGAYIATGAIALSFCICLFGLIWFLSDHPVHDEHEHGGHAAAAPAEHHEEAEGEEEREHAGADHGHSAAWADRTLFIRVGMFSKDDRPAIELHLGYYIDHLAVVMFTMVTFIAMLIHFFSMGYMQDETNVRVTDHHVHMADGGHFKRRGRYSRFFMYLSLFCFSMLNLILADNLFQIFVSWELVGICSFLLIGFYYERQSASNAANKAFITNRIGDAGFIIGMLIIWSFVGTFNFQEIFAAVRAPAADSHEAKIALRNQFVRCEETTLPNKNDPENPYPAINVTKDGSKVLLIPRDAHTHAFAFEEGKTSRATSAIGTSNPRFIPYVLLTIAGIGIFIGCVGKSAQFPLQVWLPDAMEGPTPVSALIHAATMVAAGVYLVGRAFPLFTPEARLVIAYTGGITLFIAATIAIVMNDIKKVLAYSTVSQLGYMMLALGIGGWVAGLLHLLTHAFFKALLFLGSGSVIHGCHHEQDMRKMGGLFPKMKITAITMLVGVLAIAGTPLFSGWYSKDAIIAQALAFAAQNKVHLLLLALPLVTAGITCFYMFRMWFLTFMGSPKDHHVHEHAKESPWVMTIPLIVLAVFSVIVAWGMPPWNAEASFVGNILRTAEPAAVAADFSGVTTILHDWAHPVAGVIALLAALLGAIFAFVVYYFRLLDPAETKEQFGYLYRLFDRKWYFDELYSAMLVRPALVVAHWCRNADALGIDGLIHWLGRATVWVSRIDGKIDNGVVDGLVNVIAKAIHGLGVRLRKLQTGYIRNYVLFLVLAAVAIFAVLTYLINKALAG